MSRISLFKKNIREKDDTVFKKIKNHFCISAPCLYPGIPGNGSMSGDDFRHDRTVRYTCKPGFGLEGDQLLKCSDGRWIGNKPHCKGKHSIEG